MERVKPYTCWADIIGFFEEDDGEMVAEFRALSRDLSRDLSKFREFAIAAIVMGKRRLIEKAFGRDNVVEGPFCGVFDEVVDRCDVLRYFPSFDVFFECIYDESNYVSSRQVLCCHKIERYKHVKQNLKAAFGRSLLDFEQKLNDPDGLVGHDAFVEYAENDPAFEQALNGFIQTSISLLNSLDEFLSELAERSPDLVTGSRWQFPGGDLLPADLSS